MKGYVDQPKRLDYVLPQDLTVGLILNVLTKDFAEFVRNYNMHNMGKTIGELHAMLFEYENGLPKKAETPQVMMIKSVDERMKHRCQWEWHMDHYEEDFVVLYKPYPEIQDRQRLAIPIDFLDIHPMHMYTEALMRHNGYEELMGVQMEHHRKNPRKTNHVNVF
nr:zinc finger, CCHC-type [Tanacetum cinerariifolium]